MQRKAPLTRKSRLPKVRKRTRRVKPERVRDRAYLDWVKSIGVCFVRVWVERVATSLMEIEDAQERADAQHDFYMALAEFGWCWGPFDPAHMGRDRGAGLKASDLTAVCLCRGHHTQQHDRNGFFEGWSDIEWERFETEAIEWTMARRAEGET